MRSSDLTTDQLRKLAAALRPKLEYLRQVRNRMTQRQFPENDRLYRDAMLAELGLSGLLAEIETLISFRPRK